MDPEAVINLFDSCWFNYEILKKNQSLLYNYYTKVNQSSSPSEPKFSSLRSILVRSHSEDIGNSFNYGSFSPNSVLFTPHLKSIPSGNLDFRSQKQEQEQEQEQEQDQEPEPEAEAVTAKTDPKEHSIFLEKKKSKKRGARTTSKSLSDLEFDELKGFMDLGFVFSEEDKDSSLVEIIPGLQRLGEERESDDDSNSFSSTGARRPYLSEAWKDLDRKMKKKEEKPALMIKWEVPALSDEIDMKDNLKLWAHTVASFVR